MKQESSVVHIVVLVGDTNDHENSVRDTIQALGRLGPEVSIDTRSNVESTISALEAETVDIFVLDCHNELEARGWLDVLVKFGPPVLRVLRGQLDDSTALGLPGNDDEVALDSFRRGAAQCVRVGEDYADVLPAAALELIHRWQREREEGNTERRIRWLEDLNDAIVSQIPAALVVIDGEGRVVTLNPAFSRLLSISEAAAAGKEFVGICPADLYQAGGLAAMLEATRLGKDVPARRAHWAGDGGPGQVVDLRSQRLDEDGRILLVLTDISEIKQLERQVLQSEKMASIGQLAAGVAHEINNPVGFIDANLFQLSEYLQDLQRVWDQLEVLQGAVEKDQGQEGIRRAAEGLRRVCREIDFDFVKEDLVKAVSESKEGSERIRHIVRDLRDFSRQDSGKLALADVNRCVDTTANIVWTMMKHVVTLKKDYGELPRLYCFPKQLEQVLMNLLVNACQAIQEKSNEPGMAGEVIIGEVEVRTLRRDGGVAIIIRDTGVGISPENLERIFEPFFTTKEVGAGTGLGLSTSYSIIARHGGEILVESEVGKGTMFDIWLPEIVEPEPQLGE